MAFQPGEEKDQGDFSVAFQYLKWAYEKEGEELFIWGQRAMVFKCKKAGLEQMLGRNSSL